MTESIFSLAKSHAFFRAAMLQGHAIDTVLFHSISHAKETSEQHISHLITHIDLLMQVQIKQVFDCESDQNSDLASLAHFLISLLQQLEVIRSDCEFMLESRTKGSD